MEYQERDTPIGTKIITQLENGTAIGYASIKIHPDCVYLVHIESFREGKGNATQLINHIKRKYGTPIVGNWRNQEAQGFFGRVGASFGTGRYFELK